MLKLIIVYLIKTYYITIDSSHHSYRNGQCIDDILQGQNVTSQVDNFGDGIVQELTGNR